MSLLFSLSTIPDKKRVRPVMVPLPHPLYDEKAEVCFLCKDPQKKYKELLLKTHPVPGLTKVIGLTKLRKNYNSVEAKRALADAFDLFLCDRNVVETMPKTLGSIFYQKKRKAPIPVRLTISDPKAAIEKAMRGTPLRIPAGPSIGVKIGRCSMPEEHLIANAAAVISHVIRYLEKTPVQTISIQATDSPALPIWRRPRPPGDLVDLKKRSSDTASSAASDTGVSGVSESEGVGTSEIISDAGETLSTRDTISDVDLSSVPGTPLGSAGDTLSELDSEAGDLDTTSAVAKADLPLVKGLKKKRRKGASAPPGDAAAGAAAEEKEAKAPGAAMPPPGRPRKKAKAPAA
jgi:ribosome biogenesis protein UTP30